MSATTSDIRRPGRRRHVSAKRRGGPSGLRSPQLQRTTHRDFISDLKSVEERKKNKVAVITNSTDDLPYDNTKNEKVIVVI